MQTQPRSPSLAPTRISAAREPPPGSAPPLVPRTGGGRRAGKSNLAGRARGAPGERARAVGAREARGWSASPKGGRCPGRPRLRHPDPRDVPAPAPPGCAGSPANETPPHLHNPVTARRCPGWPMGRVQSTAESRAADPPLGDAGVSRGLPAPGRCTPSAAGWAAAEGTRSCGGIPAPAQESPLYFFSPSARKGGVSLMQEKKGGTLFFLNLMFIFCID